MKLNAVLPISDSAYWDNPYAVLAEFREKFRTVYTDTGQLALLHWDDAEWAIKGHDFINEGIERLESRGFVAGDPLHTWRSHALGIMEGPDHLRLRKLASGALSKRNIEPLRPMIRDIAHGLIDKFDCDQPVDALRQYALLLPRLVMMEFLGVEADEIRGSEAPLASANIPDCFGPKVTAAMRDNANSAIQQAMNHVATLYEKRRLDPRDDLLTHLLEAEDAEGKLSHQELITLFSTIFGSGGTTGNTVAAGLLALTNNPDQAALLREDPERYKRGACEETLRMHPGIVEMPQKASRDFEAFGQSFTKHQAISIPLGAPNRDPVRWDNPHCYDISRDPDVWSLTFGIGAHFCIGQAMARYTLEEALAVFAERCNQFELAEAAHWKSFVMENRLESLSLNIQRQNL